MPRKGKLAARILRLPSGEKYPNIRSMKNPKVSQSLTVKVRNKSWTVIVIQMTVPIPPVVRKKMWRRCLKKKSSSVKCKMTSQDGNKAKKAKKDMQDN